MAVLRLDRRCRALSRFLASLGMTDAKARRRANARTRTRRKANAKARTTAELWLNSVGSWRGAGGEAGPSAALRSAQDDEFIFV